MTRLSFALGETCWQNDALEKDLGLEPGFIVEKTGIRQRYWLSDSETPSSLAAKAVQHLGLQQAPDWLLVCTSTPERLAPPTASTVLAHLGWTGTMALDLSAGCMGFLTALALAQGLVESQQAGSVLVVAVEAMSRILDPKDYKTRVLFGDGAGAVLVEPSEGKGLNLGLGIQRTVPEKADVLQVPGGLCRHPRDSQAFLDATPFLTMEGGEVFRFATTVLPEMVQAVTTAMGWSLSEVDWLLPHQSNLRILEKSAGTLGFPMEKVAHHLEQHGNMASASIPVLLSQSLQNGSIHAGQKLVLAAYGSGLAYGARAVEVF